MHNVSVCDQQDVAFARELLKLYQRAIDERRLETAEFLLHTVEQLAEGGHACQDTLDEAYAAILRTCPGLDPYAHGLLPPSRRVLHSVKHLGEGNIRN
jgi:hypothetical protein